jgi:AraC-like DNA-binding protein
MRIRRRDTHELVKRVKEFVANTAHARVRLAEISRAVGASPSYLAAIFKNAERTTIHQYLLNLRLTRAASLLAGCDDMTVLALNLGFASHSHFSSAFRRWAGSTPTLYRARLRAGTAVVGTGNAAAGPGVAIAAMGTANAAGPGIAIAATG